MIGRRTGRPTLALGGFGLLLLAALALVTRLAFSPNPGLEEDARTVLLFLGVLPLLNALADFLSLGATRLTLRMGVSKGQKVWVWMLVDLAAGAAIFLGLGCAILAWVEFVRLPDGTALIDVPRLLEDVRASLADGAAAGEAGRYWWLYIMVFSTLIPTAAHLVFASFGSMLKLNGWLRRHIAAGLEAGAAGDRVKGRWAVQWLCLSMTLTVMVPVVLVGFLWLNGDAIGLALLDVFDRVAAGLRDVRLWTLRYFAGGMLADTP